MTATRNQNVGAGPSAGIASIPLIRRGQSWPVTKGDPICIAALVQPTRPVLTNLALLWRADLVARLSRLAGRQASLVVLIDDSPTRATSALLTAARPNLLDDLARSLGADVVSLSDFETEMRARLEYITGLDLVEKEEGAWLWRDQTIDSTLQYWDAKQRRILMSVRRVARFVGTTSVDSVAPTFRINHAVDALAARRGYSETIAVSSNPAWSTPSLLLQFTQEVLDLQGIRWAAGVCTWHSYVADTAPFAPLPLDRTLENKLLALLYQLHEVDSIRLGALMARDDAPLLVRRDGSGELRSVSATSIELAERRLRLYRELSASINGASDLDSQEMTQPMIIGAVPAFSNFDVDLACRRSLEAIRNAAGSGARVPRAAQQLLHLLLEP